MFNATRNNSFGLVLTDINEVNKHIVYMTHDLIASLYLCLYNVMYGAKFPYPG